MNEEVIAISLALAFVALLLWILRPLKLSAEKSSPNIDQAMESVPRHYRYFPQIRQALSAGDHQYLRERAPASIAKQAILERRAVARRFLHGLHEDYSSLERLARMVASLSPVLSRQQEMERLLLGFKFRLLYGLVWLRLSTGAVPLQQIEHLTDLIGGFALRMEQSMTQISALSADQQLLGGSTLR